MFDLFLQGGTWIMSILTVELICLLFAAWKAPAWVREIGLLVLVTDLIWQLKGMFNAAEVVQQVGDVPLTLVAGGLKVSFISLIYALLIYAASLVIRMLRVGENTGALDDALLNVSYFYNRDVRESVQKMQQLIEPLLTVVMGGLLGWIMLSVLGPVYDVISKIKA